MNWQEEREGGKEEGILKLGIFFPFSPAILFLWKGHDQRTRKKSEMER